MENKNSKIEHFSRQLLNEIIPYIKNISPIQLGINNSYFINVFSNINKIYLDLSFNKDESNDFMTHPVSTAGRILHGLNKSYLIKIIIYLSKNAEKNINIYLSKIYFDTLAIIRHELEHLSQHDSFIISNAYISDNFDYNSKQFPLHIKAYYLQQSEKTAFISGIYLKSKKLRQSFYQVLQISLINEIEKALYIHYSKYLEKEQASQLATQESGEINNILLEEAKKRYPKLII